MLIQSDVNPDLKEEAVITLDILKRLDRPFPPTAIGSNRLCGLMTSVYGSSFIKNMIPNVSCVNNVCIFYNKIITANKIL